MRPDAFLSGAAYGSLGVVLNNAGDIDGAKAAVRKSQQMFEKAGFPVYAIGNRINLAKAFRNAGRSEEAVKMLKDMTASDLKLAAFIAVGLDTKHISRILAIRPESVKQGRWRIRTKMGLAKSDSLEEVISTYLNTPYE